MASGSRRRFLYQPTVWFDGVEFRTSGCSFGKVKKITVPKKSGTVRANKLALKES